MSFPLASSPTRPAQSRECSLYASRNGTDWERSVVHKKSRYHFTFFQLGSLVLPYACNAEPRGMYSGQAVQQVNNVVRLVEWEITSMAACSLRLRN